MQTNHQHRQLRGDLLVLIAVFCVLGGYLAYRTKTYLNQTTIQQTTTMRTGPGIEYRGTMELPKGTRVAVIRSKYEWLKVTTSANQQGWVPAWKLPAKYRPVIRSLKNATIVIDPGHGGSDSGALAVHGQMEKTYTLKFARMVAAKLRAKGAKVYLTRNSDRFVSLKARPALAKQVHANLFISFHFDSSPDENEASGFTTYYYHRGPSLQLAQDVNHQMRHLPITDKGSRFGNFLVIRNNTVPAILIEGGYINTSHDFQYIRSPRYRNVMTSDVVTGVQHFIETNH